MIYDAHNQASYKLIHQDVHLYVKFNDAIRQGHTNVMIWTVDSDAVASLFILAIKFFIAYHNGLLQCIFKTLMPGQGNLLIGFGTSRHLDTTGSFLSVSMSKLWVPKSMVKLSSMLYLAVI